MMDDAGPRRGLREAKDSASRSVPRRKIERPTVPLLCLKSGLAETFAALYHLADFALPDALGHARHGGRGTG